MVYLLGAGATALIVLFAVAGYFVGKFLDGEIDLEDLRARAQDRERADNALAPDGTTPPPQAPPRASPQSGGVASRVR